VRPGYCFKEYIVIKFIRVNVPINIGVIHDKELELNPHGLVQENTYKLVRPIYDFETNLTAIEAGSFAAVCLDNLCDPNVLFDHVARSKHEDSEDKLARIIVGGKLYVYEGYRLHTYLSDLRRYMSGYSYLKDWSEPNWISPVVSDAIQMLVYKYQCEKNKVEPQRLTRRLAFVLGTEFYTTTENAQEKFCPVKVVTKEGSVYELIDGREYLRMLD
jgi:hypothetical protein